MSKGTKLALVADHDAPDATGPAREALREAIAARRDLEDQLAALNTALGASGYGDSWEPRREAERALKGAQKALQAAKDEAAEHLASAAIGRACAAPANVEAARRRLVEAEDAAEVARRAEATMQQQVKEIENRLTYARDRAQQAAEAVLRGSPAIGRLVDEIGRLQRDLFARSRALGWLIGKHTVPMERVKVGAWETAEAPASLAMNRFRSPIATWRELVAVPECRGEEPWQAALAALLADADAPLPA